MPEHRSSRRPAMLGLVLAFPLVPLACGTHPAIAGAPLRPAVVTSPSPTPVSPSPSPTAPALGSANGGLGVHAAECGATAPALAALSAGLAVAFDPYCWQALGDLIGAGIGAAANAAIGAVAQWISSGAASASTLLLTSLQNEATSPTLSAPWFTSVYYGGGAGGRPPSQPGALTIASWLMVMVVTGSLLVGIIRGDVGGMVRLVAFRLPVAILVSYLAIWLVTALLRLTDVATGWVLHGGVASLDQWVGMLDMQSQSHSIGTDLLTVLACLLLLIATLLSYVELLARDAGVYIVTAFIPLIAVASLWSGGHGALKKGAETLFVLGIAKFVMVFTLVLGAAALTSAPDLHDFSALLTGTLIFVIAALAPATIFRLVPILEGAAVGLMAGGASGWVAGRASTGFATARSGAGGSLGLLGGGASWLGSRLGAGSTAVAGASGGSGGSTPPTRSIGDSGPPPGGGPTLAGSGGRPPADGGGGATARGTSTAGSKGFTVPGLATAGRRERGSQEGRG